MIWDPETDRLRQLSFSKVFYYQTELIQITGINAIRLKYVQHQRIFLEIGKQHQEQFEKATDTVSNENMISNAGSQNLGECYVTSYLKNLEVRVF